MKEKYGSSAEKEKHQMGWSEKSIGSVIRVHLKSTRSTGCKINSKKEKGLQSKINRTRREPQEASGSKSNFPQQPRLKGGQT